MDERDRLATAIDKLSSEEVRLLARFAAVMAEEQKADPMHDTGDVGQRLEQFRQWCAANKLDLAAVEAWVQQARTAAASSR